MAQRQRHPARAAAHARLDKTVPDDIVGMLCFHCGGSLTLRLPMPMGEVGAAMTAFADRHQGCPPRARRNGRPMNNPTPADPIVHYHRDVYDPS